MPIGSRAMPSANLVAVGALVAGTSSGATNRSDGVGRGQQRSDPVHAWPFLYSASADIGRAAAAQPSVPATSSLLVVLGMPRRCSSRTILYTKLPNEHGNTIGVSTNSALRAPNCRHTH